MEWVDSGGVNGWHSLTEHDSICKCISVGIVCKEDNTQVVLALNRSNYGSVGDTMAIPKACITRMRKLKVK